MKRVNSGLKGLIKEVRSARYITQCTIYYERVHHIIIDELCGERNRTFDAREALDRKSRIYVGSLSDCFVGVQNQHMVCDQTYAW